MFQINFASVQIVQGNENMIDVMNDVITASNRQCVFLFTT